jgi:hypothetical protein
MPNDRNDDYENNNYLRHDLTMTRGQYNLRLEWQNNNNNNNIFVISVPTKQPKRQLQGQHTSKTKCMK